MDGCTAGPSGRAQAPVARTRWTILTRLLEVAVLISICSWVVSHLGGLGFQPRRVRNAEHVIGNDTSRVFNWHPILNTLGFAVFMSEALLAYQAPVATSLDRGGQKLMHVVMHALALLCCVLALTAAVQSHTLKRPDPIPNFYSVHSWLGLVVYILVLIQFLAGVVAFLFPKLPLRKRAELAPLHSFLGRCIYSFSLAVMAVGIQEKATLTQLGARLGPQALRQPVMTLPAATVLLLAALGVLVLAHHAVLRPTASAGGAKVTEEVDELLAPPNGADSPTGTL